MRAGVASAVLLTMCTCTGPSKEVQACEALLLPSLKAPSTYKLVDATAFKAKNGGTDVFIRYDAVNSYNAPIRDTFGCKVDAAGAASSVQPENERRVEDAARRLAEPQTINESRHQPDREQVSDEEEVPVCDRPESPEKRALMNEIGVDCMGE